MTKAPTMGAPILNLRVTCQTGTGMSFEPFLVDDYGSFTASELFPYVPLMNALGVLGCILVLPVFWRTGVFAIKCHVIACLIPMLIDGFNMGVVWRGHARDIKIYGRMCE